ncbi:MAG: hypothetical protein DRH57_06730 [Candidatus Cloacimonadota bacterium]|nr:MAG: hypothetical protein DRH57_06730 [Candidatus Cloacimonadota bacterium]
MLLVKSLKTILVLLICVILISCIANYQTIKTTSRDEWSNTLGVEFVCTDISDEYIVGPGLIYFIRYGVTDNFDFGINVTPQLMQVGLGGKIRFLRYCAIAVNTNTVLSTNIEYIEKI